MPITLDTRELAWAAGLFDAEGSACASLHHRGHVYVPRIQLSQAGTATPEVLTRFRAAVGGLGQIYGPVRGYLYYWCSNKFETVQAVAAFLWAWLGVRKRTQLRRTLLLARGTPLVERPMPAPGPTDQAHARAWAAGFFGGEGWIGGASWSPGRFRYLRMAIAQATFDGAVPDTLRRFQLAADGLGYIRGPRAPASPWSRLPQYVWSCSRYDDVIAVLDKLAPCLDTERVRRASAALGRYRATPALPELPRRSPDAGS